MILTLCVGKSMFNGSDGNEIQSLRLGFVVIHLVLPEMSLQPNFTQVVTTWFWPLYTISLYIPFRIFFFFFWCSKSCFWGFLLATLIADICVANTVTSCQGNKGQFYAFELKSPTVDIEKAEHHEKNNNLKFKTTICENWLTACVCI